MRKILSKRKDTLTGCLFFVSLGICVIAGNSTKAVSQTLNLDVTNLNCTIDQIHSGTDPLYRVSPEKCMTPQAGNIINTIIDDDRLLTDESHVDVPSLLLTPLGEAQDGASDSIRHNGGSTHDIITSHSAPSSSQTAVPEVITLVATGGGVVGLLIVLDVAVLHSQVTLGLASGGRRWIRYILRIFMR